MCRCVSDKRILAALSRPVPAFMVSIVCSCFLAMASSVAHHPSPQNVAGLSRAGVARKRMRARIATLVRDLVAMALTVASSSYVRVFDGPPQCPGDGDGQCSFSL